MVAPVYYKSPGPLHVSMQVHNVLGMDIPGDTTHNLLNVKV